MRDIRDIIQKIWKGVRKGIQSPHRVFNFKRIVNFIDNTLMISEYARACEGGQRIVLRTDWEMSKKKENLETFAHLQRYEWVIKELSLQKVDTLLDMGCGTGYGTAKIAKELNIPFVVGIDISENAIAYASKHYHAPNLWFKKMDALALKFPKEFFDVIISFDVIEHLEQLDQYCFLDNMLNVMKSNAIVYIGCPNAKVRLARGEHHKYELSAEEFVVLLNEYFNNIKFLCQDIVVDGERKQENWYKYISARYNEYNSVGIFNDKCEKAYGLLAICTNPKKTRIS